MRYMLERAFFEIIHFPFSFPALRGIYGGGHFLGYFGLPNKKSSI